MIINILHHFSILKSRKCISPDLAKLQLFISKVNKIIKEKRKQMQT